MRVKVYLETMNDVARFVAIATQIDVPVHLVGHDFRVSAKYTFTLIFFLLS